MSFVCPRAVPAAQGLIRESGNFVLPCPAPCIFATKPTPGGRLLRYVPLSAVGTRVSVQHPALALTVAD
jgi:hypothetical protein